MLQASTRRLLEGSSAWKSVETGLPLVVNNATMATRETMMGAAQHARPSADSTALAVYVRQSAETALSLTARHVTTATRVVGMDAVRTAQM